MDNYVHQIENFSVGVVFLEVVGVNKCHKPFPPPPPPQYAKWGWCAAVTLGQYLVFRECRKVAQHCCRQNAELLNVKADGTYSYHWVLK
jgi:hypothetical protein